MKSYTRKLVLSGLFLALAMLLPLVTAQNQALGNMLCPMHFPVLLCGLVCGGAYGMAVGAIAPILRFFIFNTPPLLPTGTAMAFELAVYGLVSGLVSNTFAKKVKEPARVYISLATAMLAGRLVWGCVMWFIQKSLGADFTMKMFLTQAYVTAVWGIVIQLAIIPPIAALIKKWK